MKCGTCGRFASGMCLFMDCETTETKDACPEYIPGKTKKTIGEAIQQGGNRAIAKFAYKTARITTCGVCAFSTIEQGEYICNARSGQQCVDGIEAYLNSPAESEGER